MAKITLSECPRIIDFYFLPNGTQVEISLIGDCTTFDGALLIEDGENHSTVGHADLCKAAGDEPFRLTLASPKRYVLTLSMSFLAAAPTEVEVLFALVVGHDAAGKPIYRGGTPVHCSISGQEGTIIPSRFIWLKTLKT